MIPRLEIDCPHCGWFVSCIWGGEDIKWTGRCGACGSILMFITKEDIKHGELQKETANSN